MAVTWAVPGSGYIDENTNTCSGRVFIVLGMNGIGFLAICFLWCDLQICLVSFVKFLRCQYSSDVLLAVYLMDDLPPALRMRKVPAYKFVRSQHPVLHLDRAVAFSGTGLCVPGS